MNTENNTNITPNSTPAKSSINPIVKWLRNIGCGLLITLILGSGGYVYWKYYSVFGEGVKSGVLNYVVLKGDIGDDGLTHTDTKYFLCLLLGCGAYIDHKILNV